MIIKYLLIKNFGCFYDQIRLELEPSDDPQKYIILIGGDNGLGKTTILNAIKICLYGRRAPDLWKGQKEYREFIARKFNDLAFKKGQREMVLELGLNVWEHKIKHELVVRRSYHLTDNRLYINDNQESLDILRDGKPLEIPRLDITKLAENKYDDLLRILVPTHFAQFYFFDGEHVRELFNLPSAENVSQAIRDLLGLSILEQLIKDLKDYRRQKIPTLYGKHKQQKAELLKKQGERDQIRGDLEQLKISFSEVIDELTDISNDLNLKEKEFKQLGGIQKAQLDELKDAEKQCNLDYERLTKQLKDALASQISICFVLPFKQYWEDRIEAETIRKEWLIKRKAVEPHVTSLIEKIVGESAPKPSPPLTDSQKGFLSNRIGEEVKNLFWPPPPKASKDTWFDLRQQDIDQINSHFNEALYFTSNTLKDIILTKQRVFEQRHRIQEQLRHLSEADETQEIADKIKQLHERKGALSIKKDELEPKIEHVRSKLSELEKQITNLSRDCEKSAKGQKKDELSQKVEMAIKEYIELSSKRSADEIESYLNELFFSILSSKDEFKEIKLDRQNYSLKLIQKDGKERLIETGLSAGQAQVLAMCFVGALAKASGRILPFIIDTPLGRLDVDHRRNVTEKFFIGNTPQTILLSTPTEINNCTYDEVPLFLLDSLRQNVAKVYTLVREIPGVTKIENNYFGIDV